MLEQEVLDALNFQINREFYSAFLYRDLANFFAAQDLEGFSHWYNIQATEEKEHAILMMQYVTDSGSRVKLLDVEAPPYDYESLAAPVRLAYEHEQKVTGYIHALLETANRCNDHQTASFVDYFVREQGEEEKNARSVLRRIERVAEDSAALYALDRELAQRVYVQNPGVRDGVVS